MPSGLAKAVAAALALLAAAGLLLSEGRPAEPPSHVAWSTTLSHARLLQQLEAQAPVAAPTPAVEVAAAAPAAEVGAPVPGPAGETISASEALFTAIRARNVPEMQRLFAAGASTDVYSPAGSTPLMEAISLNAPSVVDAILAKGVDTNLPDRQTGDTPLILAVRQGNFPLVQRLLDAGADINLKNNAGDTALLVAVKAQPPPAEIIQLLLSRRPSPTTSAPDLAAADAQGRTARDVALASGDPRLAALFQGVPAAEAPQVGPTVPVIGPQGGPAGGGEGQQPQLLP